MAKAAQSKSSGKKSASGPTKKPAAKGNTNRPPKKPEDMDGHSVDPEVLKKIATVRDQVRGNFGKIVLAMMVLPRYRHQTWADLQALVLEPLIRDRIAIAYPGGEGKEDGQDMSGMAIWASVSPEVDRKIRDQISTGTFPLRLTPDDWNSGDINWLLDVIAPDQKTTGKVIANFRQVVKGGELRLHPLVTNLLDKEALEDMGAKKLSQKSQSAK